MSYRSAAAGGWMEVLFQRQPKPFRQLEEIKEDNYTMVGSAFPLLELDSTYDLYTMVDDGRFFGAPRRPMHGDVMNVCLRTKQVRTYLLVDMPTFNRTMEDGVYPKVNIVPGKMGMMCLPQRFSSFASRRVKG